MNLIESATVAIVGRPNVGKSALFNRLCGRRQAIVAHQAGVTRDRIYGSCTWNGVTFRLIDTGGMDPDSPDILRREVYRQAEKALEEADLLLFVVDILAGIHPLDEEVAAILRQRSKPVILVANKAENPKSEGDSYEFYRLGLGDPITVSALHGTNTGDLLDLVVSRLEHPVSNEVEAEVSIALIGKPNVGKSSLLNALLGQERALVHEKAGTTRDSIDTLISFEGVPIRLVDTAGLRRKGKLDDELEYYSAVRAMSAIRRAQVALLVIDARVGLVSQDKRIMGYVLEAGLAAIILVNKWDLVIPLAGCPSQLQDWKDEFAGILARELDFASWCPVLYVSAKEGTGIDQILPACLEVHNQWSRRIDTPVLNQVISEAVALRPPPSYKGKHLKIYYVSQKSTQPPTFVFKVNSPKLLHFSYRRYLENQLRQAFGFVGTPIRMVFEK